VRSVPACRGYWCLIEFYLIKRNEEEYVKGGGETAPKSSNAQESTT